MFRCDAWCKGTRGKKSKGKDKEGAVDDAYCKKEEVVINTNVDYRTQAKDVDDRLLME